MIAALVAFALVLIVIVKESPASTVQAHVLIGEGLQSTVHPLAFESTTVPGESVSASASGTRAPFTGSGSASAVSQFLRTSTTGSLSSTAHDENYDFEADTGKPPVYIVQSSASFRDTLAYSGSANNYKSTYILRLTGSISGTGAFALVGTNHGSFSDSWLFDTPGSYNRIITSSTFVGGFVPETFAMSIIAGFNADTSTLLGQSSSGVSQFGNTLELIGIDLRNADTNELLPQGSVVGSSGTVYQIIDANSIPEPATLVLLAVGLLGYRIVRSKR